MNDTNPFRPYRGYSWLSQVCRDEMPIGKVPHYLRHNPERIRTRSDINAFHKRVMKRRRKS